MAFTASSSFVPNSCKYDVFISFRGPDTRNNFISHLYAALCREKIVAFIDSENLESGEQISTLFRIIEESTLSIVIFSKNYASSGWCLDELVCIMKCNKKKQHVVLPVFHGIDPSAVRNQEGSYADAFAEHEKHKDKTKKVQEWKKALKAAADLSGFVFQNGLVPVSQLIEEIVKKILEIGSDAFTGLVGMEKRFKQIESSLRLGSQGVRIIGIWGMGGIGKTTLARTVYNKICSQFESNFYTTFSGESSKDELHHLENVLISTLLKDDNLDHMQSSFASERLRRKMLRRKMVLIVLDNVNQRRQLECLYRLVDSQQIKDRIGVGSRIILTSRDRKLLEDTGAEIYDVEALDFDEARKLFCRKAFGGDSPMTDFEELSEKVVRYAQGNPLTLEVLGSHLYKRSVREWESTLKGLGKTTNKDIHKVLKISYDELDAQTKGMFLDTAFFFEYKRKDFVEAVLGYWSVIGIEILIEKSLITITEDCMIKTHDLLREMASEIVKRESKEVGRRSRLNNAQDVFGLLQNDKGTTEIEGIFLDLTKIPKDLCLSSTTFEVMSNLRILIIYSHPFLSTTKSINFPNGLGYLPDSLRYLKWCRCPLNSLPSKFDPRNLVKLEMQESSVKELWNEVKHLWNLKDINLSFSEELIKLPDLSQAPKLENINLSCCCNLRGLPNISASLKYLDLSISGIEALPSSFGSIENIVNLNLHLCQSLKNLPELPTNIEILDLSECESLESLPSNIWKLKSLQNLNLSFCSSLKTLPEISEVLEHLQDLSLKETGIEELPSSIENITGLRNLDLRDCEYLKFVPKCLNNLSYLSNLILVGCSKLGCFPPVFLGLNLTRLELGYCNIQEIPDWLGSLSSVTYIDLRGNNFETIASSIIQLAKLGCLRISDCKKLRHLPELPFSIVTIDASECTSLETIDCSEAFKELASTPGKLKKHEFSFGFHFYNCCEMKQSSRLNVLVYFLYSVHNHIFSSKLPAVTTCYPGNEIPYWFSTRWEGSTVTTKLPQDWLNQNFLGLAICIALESPGPLTILKGKEAVLSFKTNDDEKKYIFNGKFLIPELDDYGDSEITIRSDHVLMWYRYDPNMKHDFMNLDEVVASIEIDAWFDKIVKVKRCGLRLIFG